MVMSMGKSGKTMLSNGKNRLIYDLLDVRGQRYLSDDPSVRQFYHPPAFFRDNWVVSYDDDRFPRVVKILQQVHDGFGALAVQCPRRLVRKNMT